jgi:hypothetical protein
MNAPPPGQAGPLTRSARAITEAVLAWPSFAPHASAAKRRAFRFPRFGFCRDGELKSAGFRRTQARAANRSFNVVEADNGLSAAQGGVEALRHLVALSVHVHDGRIASAGDHSGGVHHQTLSVLDACARTRCSPTNSKGAFRYRIGPASDMRKFCDQFQLHTCLRFYPVRRAISDTLSPPKSAGSSIDQVKLSS